MLGSVSAVLPVCAAENDTAYTVTVPVGTRTTQLTYAVNAEDTVEITDCENDAAGDLEIPAEIDGKTVTSIGDSAFYGCTSLAEITIPSSVTSIGGTAFQNTPWLAARQEENSLVIVNGILLDGTTCTEEEIVIPNDVTSICGEAFFRNHMTNVEIPDSVTSIGSYAFSDCGNLKNITIPDSVTFFGEGVFAGSLWLEYQYDENPLVIINHILVDVDREQCSGKVTIPDGITSITEGAFAYCDQMTEISIPDSVNSIGSFAFNGCMTLKE
ncbi:MAG: leucine-rich repeat domain-containing protein, partial [Ruminococcus callidus]|nr:leucine-rich repeat domain-containing protein [Ruminococcus callidus]